MYVWHGRGLCEQSEQRRKTNTFQAVGLRTNGTAHFIKICQQGLLLLSHAYNHQYGPNLASNETYPESEKERNSLDKFESFKSL